MVNSYYCLLFIDIVNRYNELHLELKLWSWTLALVRVATRGVHFCYLWEYGGPKHVEFCGECKIEIVGLKYKALPS